MRASLAGLIAALICMVSPTTSHGDHERFIVGSMRNVDPSGDVVISTSGTCVPSHDRERLDCYFTTFGLWKSRKAEDLRKDIADFITAFDKEPTKQLRDMRKSFCDDKSMTSPDPARLKYDASAQTFFSSLKAFCERPSRDSAMSMIRTMSESQAKKCNCVVSDWRSTLVRQVDRWIENSGPNGLCGVIKVFTLVPQDIKKMKEPTGPLLWTLHDKTLTTHSSSSELCAKGLFRVEEGTTTVSWNAPSKTIECSEFEFTSALEGMSDPRGPKGK